MDGIYCEKRLTKILCDEVSLKIIPIELLVMVSGYASDSRFVHPLTINQNIIFRYESPEWFDARIIQIQQLIITVQFNYDGWIINTNVGLMKIQPCPTSVVYYDQDSRFCWKLQQWVNDIEKE